jgi:hypothetical protein
MGRMNAWLREIDRATTEAEIVAQTRDFFSLVHPRDLAFLPEAQRTIHIDTDSDIPLLRERLVQGSLHALTTAHDADRVREMLSYLSKAAERLGEIRSSH